MGTTQWSRWTLTYNKVRMTHLFFTYFSLISMSKKIPFYLFFTLLSGWLGSCSSTHQSQKTSSLDVTDEILQTENSLLWRISGNGIKQPSYLYGTIHIIKDEDFHIGNNLKKKLLQAKRVVMEVDLSKVNVVKLAQLSILPDYKSIKEYLSDSDYTEVRQFYIDSLKIGASNFDMAYSHFKPFFLEQMLYINFMGNTMQSYEEEFKSIAEEKNIALDGLETMDEQLAFINEIPIDEQFKSIVDAIKHYNENTKKLDTLVQYYKEQNLTKLSEYFSGEDAKVYTETLVDKRNANWIAKLENFIQKEPCFIAVGAGHLAGEKGIINLLRKQGYTVEAIKTD